MKIASSLSLLVGLLCLSVNAFADTEQVSSTAYQVLVQEPEIVELPGGRKISANGAWHATVINDQGETLSQWCTGEQWLGADGMPVAGAGYCTIFDDDGNVLWVSFVNGAAGQPGTWTVMGGTGEYAGATGGGTNEMVSQRSDGYAWTSKSSGTIVTP